jgi:hypothetical protein
MNAGTVFQRNDDSSEMVSSIQSRANPHNFSDVQSNLIYANIHKDRHKYTKTSTSKIFILINVSLEKKTIVFDFDETLAKVSFNKDTLPTYEE